MPTRRKKKRTMPGLTVDKSPPSQPQTSRGHSPHATSRSASPVRPPVSPITPTLSHVRISGDGGPIPASMTSNPSLGTHHGASATTTTAAAPRQTYTHTQPPQTAIPQPAPVPIALDENTDALALKAAMSILQLQARNAERDMRRLARMKERAMQDPEGFARAVARGDVRTQRGDGLFNPSGEDGDEEGDEDEDSADEKMTGVETGSRTAAAEPGGEEGGKEERWGKFPTPQNVVRCPPINWQKYAVVGESLDKLHVDQKARPTEGRPQIMGPDGRLRYGGDAPRRPADLGIAAPYQPSRDKIEKMSTRKGGKR